MTDYSTLIEAALADVESGAAAYRSCNTSERCREASGCPRCLSGVMKGDIGIESITVFKSGTVRLVTTGHNGRSCTVAFTGIEVRIHE